MVKIREVYMKRVLVFIIICMSLFVLVGCQEKKVNPTYISAENIYDLDSDKYLIYFEKEDCSQCAATLPTIINYLTKTSGKRDAVKVYSVLLEFTDENGEKVSIPISRAFTGGDTKQGPDGNFYVNGVSNWVALYIAAAPSLIEVSTVDGKKQSTLIAVGTSEIETYINNLLK